MARIQLDIHDPLIRVALKAMLEATGHRVVRERADAALTDDLASAAERATVVPTVVAVRAGEIPRAVAAMRRGVYGYISIPLQPGEADIAVRHALQASSPARPADTRVSTLHEVEAGHIQDVLRRCKGNHAEAARLLGIGRNTLWRKLRRADESET